MAQLPLRATSSLPWYSLSMPTTPPYTAPSTSTEAQSHTTLAPTNIPLPFGSSISLDGYHAAFNMPRIGIQRAPSLDHFQHASWRQYSKYNEDCSMALGQANATPHQLACGKTSSESPQSPVFGDCSASPTLVAVPRPNTLPYVLVSHERVHVALSIATPVTSPFRAVEIWSDGNTCNTTAQPVTANLLASDEEHDHDRTNEETNNSVQIRSSKVFECNDADMTDACGGHQDDAVPCAHHSQTCLFSCTGFLRPLPLADSFAVPDKFDQETPPSISSSLPLFSDLRRQKSIHPACRPLPQLRTPPYGIQTSHVRDSPRYFPLDIQGALGNGDTAFHMKNKSLPPIQTVLDGIETPGHQANVNDIADDPWNDQPCFRYLSYPSPLSSMDSATYQTPPTDRLASHQADRLDCDFQVPQTTGPQYADWTPVDVMQKQWTLHDHSRLAARSWDKRNTPSLFTSSDIERASSIESQFDHEGPYEAESETTIFLGDFCATSPGSSSLVLTDARLSYSATSTTSTGAFACTPAESGTAGVSLSSPKSVLRRSTSDEAMQEPLPGARLVYMRPTSSAPVSSDDSDSSGSDYEASVMCKKPDGKPNRPETGNNTLAKFTTTKVRKQGNLKNEKSTGVEKKKKQRRSVQRKTSLGTYKARSFQCDHCSMAFHRRHDMKRHSRLHTGEKPYKCPSKACGEAFERNDQLRRHLERTEACRKKAPSLSEHSFCQGAIRKKRP